MSDRCPICDRQLRVLASGASGDGAVHVECFRARIRVGSERHAAEIDLLRSQLARAREALKRIEGHAQMAGYAFERKAMGGVVIDEVTQIESTAVAALAELDDKESGT